MPRCRLHAIIPLMVVFYLEHAAALLLILTLAASTGTAVSGRRFPIALRSALGLAVAGQLFVLFGIIGILRPWSFTAFAIVSLVMGAFRAERPSRIGWSGLAIGTLLLLPLFVFALSPPVAFDETLYHMPFVRALAEAGRIGFFSGLRFPAFPQLHELLCVPLFLLLGDQAAHLVSLAEIIILCGLMVEWAGAERRGTGWLAAALVLGSPIVAQLASVTYVESALMMFVAAGFCCLERAASEESEDALAAGILLGSACSVKLLGFYFAGAGLLFLFCFASRRFRMAGIFAVGAAASVLPMYGRIVALTGNPLFPFMGRLFGQSQWAPRVSLASPSSPVGRLWKMLRLSWDVTFARERLNAQPHFTPLFLVAVAILLISALRNRRARFYAVLFAGYAGAMTFLPQDSRYVTPLLPLVAVVAVALVAQSFQTKSWFSWGVPLLALLVAAPGPAYAVYRLCRQGLPPVTAPERRQYLERRIPEYRALERRGPGRIYVCGAEQLKYFGGNDLLGDVIGPGDEWGVIGDSRNSAELAGRLSALGVRYLLLSRRACRPEWVLLPAPPEFEVVYRDEAAVLWRVR